MTQTQLVIPGPFAAKIVFQVQITERLVYGVMRILLSNKM